MPLNLAAPEPDPLTSGQREILATLRSAWDARAKPLALAEINLLLDRCTFAEVVDLDRHGWVRIGESGSIELTEARRCR